MIILLQEPSLRKEFINLNPNYVSNINEEDILFFFERWVIRVQEQAFISVLRPTLNKDNVKFQLKWEPKNIATPPWLTLRSSLL